MRKSPWLNGALASAAIMFLAAPIAEAQRSPYRIKGPIEEFFNSNDQDGDTDMVAQLLGNNRGETLFRPDTITDLERIRINADTFKGVEVLFIGRFHQIGNVFNAFYTHFTPDEYVNFSVWGQHQRLWTQEGVVNDFPFCYIANTHAMIDRFLSLERLDTVLWKGVSRSSLAGEAWIEIIGFWQMDGKLTSDDTRDIGRAEDMIHYGDWENSAAIYTRLAESGLPDSYGTWAQMRAAETSLMTGDYRGALRYSKQVHAEHGGSEEIAKLHHRIVRANAEGGCEGCPPPRTGKVESHTSGGMVPWQDGHSAPSHSPPPPVYNPEPQHYYTPPAPNYTPPPPGGSVSYPSSSPSMSAPAPSSSPSAVVISSAPPPAPMQPSPPPAPPAQPSGASQDQLDRPGRGY